LHELGYEVESFGKDSFVIQEHPLILNKAMKNTIENLLEQFKHFSSDLNFQTQKLIRSLTWQHAVKAGTSLGQEMKSLIEDLFNCAQPNMSAGGNPTYMSLDEGLSEKLFSR
jgi:DNA mismatch repair protein MutL